MVAAHDFERQVGAPGLVARYGGSRIGDLR